MKRITALILIILFVASAYLVYLYFSKIKVKETKNTANSTEKPLNNTQTAENTTNYSTASRENKTAETSEAENTTSYKAGVNKTAENVPSNFNKSRDVSGQGYPRIACYYLTDINLSKIENRSFAVLVLEFEEGLNTENLMKLKELNGLVLAYINFGYAEAWRDYWPKIQGKNWVHSRTEYEDEYYVEYWREEWHKIILEKVAKAYRLGFDGVYFDNVDACTVLEEEKPKWARGLNLTSLMIKSISNLSAIIKEHYGADFKVYVNIGSALRLLGDSRFLHAIDGVLREEVWYTVKGSKSVEIPAEEKELALKYLIKAREANKTVIVADFVDSAERAGEFCRLCWSLGFIPVPQPVWAADYSQPPPEDWCKNKQNTENISVAEESQESKIRSIPWGAMYIPSEYYGYKGISGVVAYYRGAGSVARLLSDLEKARKMKVKVILTLGSVNPRVYLDSSGHINMSKVYQELAPFFAVSSKIQPYIDDGTVWGIRFMDEPHNPAGYPRGFKVKETELGEVFALIKSYFKGVRVGSSAPASYMINVPHADFAFGQYNHGHPPPGYSDPVDYFKKELALARKHGLLYVASLNSNNNPVDNYTFFKDYIRICMLGVDFMTSWQWSRRPSHPYPSFFERLNDPSVQQLIQKIPEACSQKP